MFQINLHQIKRIIELKYLAGNYLHTVILQDCNFTSRQTGKTGKVGKSDAKEFSSVFMSIIFALKARL